jgi:hypothetical protein
MQSFAPIKYATNISYDLKKKTKRRRKCHDISTQIEWIIFKFFYDDNNQNENKLKHFVTIMLQIKMTALWRQK